MNNENLSPNVQQRTWPYGTRLKATVLDVVAGKQKALVLEDEKGEGHILLNTSSDLPAQGATVVMVFTKGGPMGGYWEIIDLKTAKEHALRHLDQDDPRGAMACLIPHVEANHMLKNDAAIFLVQIMTSPTVEKVRRFIKELPDE